jgi:hypothetical protein
MTNLSRKFEQIINRTLTTVILPVKTTEGILVGDVLITSQGSAKNIVKSGEIKYQEIYLNSVAIKIAELLIGKNHSQQADTLYKLDQEYGKWLNESQLLRTQYEKAVANAQHDRADVLWAKYQQSRDRTVSAKSQLDALAH